MEKKLDRTRERANHKRYRARVRAKALDHLGNVCVRCGFSDPRALQIDHVNGNGLRETKGHHQLKICFRVL